MYTGGSLAVLTTRIRRLELVTRLCSALRRCDLYVYLRLHRLQPIMNCNCSQPLERPRTARRIRFRRARRAPTLANRSDRMVTAAEE